MINVELELDNTKISATVKNGVWETSNARLSDILTKLSSGLIQPMVHYPNTDAYIANKIINDFFDGRGHIVKKDKTYVPKEL